MHNNTRVFPQLLRSRPLHPLEPVRRVCHTEQAPVIIRGRDQVAAARSLVLDLASATGQTAAFAPLDVLVRSPAAMRKIPCLVLVRLPSRGPAATLDETVPGVDAAVLMYEYRFAGTPMRLFSTDDMFGERTVLAPHGMRFAAAQEACRVLSALGALACLVSFEGSAGTMACSPAGLASDCEIGSRVRYKERDLWLAPTYEDTLRNLGPGTRHNMRRYRTRAEQLLGAHFIPDAGITPAELLELNQDSTNPVPPEVARWRAELAAAQPDRIFAGLRASDGRWLSIVSGYRQEDRAVLEWQTNRAGLLHHSISTAMRSFLIEHETALGTARISFQGGTHHTLALSLEAAPTTDVIAVAPGLTGKALRRVAHRVLPPSNFLGRALADPEVTWRPRFAHSP